MLAGLQDYLAEMERGNQAAADQTRVRRVMAELVFLYWAKRLKHEATKLDPEREKVILKRLEAGDSINELLCAVDGTRKDPNLMGQNERNQRYDRVSTIFRNREQVERLAELGGYRDGTVHPIAAKYLGLEANSTRTEAVN